MSDYCPKLANRDFINWIKTRIATDIFRTCVEPFVATKITSFQNEILQTIASELKNNSSVSCCDCTTENVLECRTKHFCIFTKGRCIYHCSGEKMFRPCPQNICNRVKDKILQNHCFHSPSWKNTNAQNWCTNAWELAKCYMPLEGYSDKTSIENTDLNGILSVMINHSNISKEIEKTTCEEIRNYWNSLRHSVTFLVTDEKLTLFLRSLWSFLENSRAFIGDEKAKDAVTKIKQIKDEKLSISTADVTKILKKSIEEEKTQSIEAIDSKSKSYLDKLEELKHGIEKTSSKNISKVESAGEKAIGDITSVVSTGKIEIGNATNDALAKIEFHKRGTSCIQLTEKLKKDLLDWNEFKNNTIPIAPLFEEEEMSVIEFYACPQLVSVERQPYGSVGTDKRIPIKSLKDVFYIQQKRYNEIYLTAEAGFGKSCFSKFVVTTWWYALTQDTYPSNQCLSTEDINVMKDFTFVFLVNLREVGDECDVDEMIFQHIIKCLSHSSEFSLSFLQNILHDENCLIILDGLDEWSHSNNSQCLRMYEKIPHRKARQACTILTTSRPWKLGEINLKASQIGKHVELCKLTGDSISFIKNLLVTHLIGKNTEIVNFMKNLNAEIKDNELENLESNPILLIYLICLKTEEKHLGKSKSVLYLQIIDLLLVRALQKAEVDMKTESIKPGSPEDSILPCFRAFDLPRKYYHLLKTLGKLAFITLFDDSNSNTLVFDKSRVNRYLSDEYIRISLSSGILTETKIFGSILFKKFRVSFCHRTVQEYLAALYMSTTEEKEEMVKVTLKFCKSVGRLLVNSNVFVFLCGLNHKTFIEHFSNEIASVVNTDKDTRDYRQTCISSTSNYDINIKPLKDLQLMFSSCLKEIESQDEDRTIPNIEVSILMNDLFIDKDCKNYKYMQRLKKIKDMNQSNIKSVSIRIEWDSDLRDICSSLQLETETSLEKVNFRGKCWSNDIVMLLSKSVDSLKCVEILSSMWTTDERFVPKYTVWTDSLTNIFQSMNNLQALHLYAFEMSHSQLNGLLSYIKDNSFIKDIAILNLKCTDHKDVCTGCHLSRHGQLRLLSIDNVPLSEISVDVSHIEDCVIGKISNSRAFLVFLTALKSAKKVQSFTCRHINTKAEIGTMIETMCELPNLRVVRLLYCDLCDTQFFLSNKLTKIELVRLVEVTMKCCVLQSIATVIKELSQPVTIELYNCNVNTMNEFEKLKREIKEDRRILVLQEGPGCDLLFRYLGNLQQ